MKNKNRFLSLLGILPMLFSCGAPEANESVSSAPSRWTTHEVVKNDDVLPVETSFELLDPIYKKANPNRKGTVEKFEYTTSVYGEGTEFRKYANVYLPYGYDKDDTSKKWNIMYYQHGDKRNQDVLVSYKDQNTDAKNQIDNLFDPDRGGVEPCIIVFTTLYLFEDPSEFTQETLAGDTGVGVPANYNLELRQDIVPGIEAKYNTYANHDVSIENIVATRDHRTFAGYSRGCARVWAMFIQNYDLFHYYCAMSCPITGTSFGGGDSQTNLDGDRYAPYLAQMVDARNAFPELPFFIYGYTGNATNDFPATRTWLRYLYDSDLTNYGDNPAINNYYVGISKYDHVDTVVPDVWYNALKYMFK